MAPPLELHERDDVLVPRRGRLATRSRAICDSQLNAVDGAERHLLQAADADGRDRRAPNITKSYSTTPPDSQKGWMGERDFGVWVPVVKYHGGKPGKIGWYLPYVFVDNVAAMVTGREVFGFFKQTATLAMPRAPSAPGAFSIDALVIPKFSPESRGPDAPPHDDDVDDGRARHAAGTWTGVRDARRRTCGTP